MKGRRVALTGLGCLTPIGNGVPAFTEGLRSGLSGVGRIALFDPAALDVTIAAEVKGFDPESALPAKELRHVARVVPLSIAAAGEALASAGIDTESLSLEERRRIAVVFGTGGGPVEFFEKMYGHWYRGDLKKASVYSIPTGTMGTLSSEISMRFGLKGRSHVITTGCTSSADAMGYAARLVAWGDEDLVLTGGGDAVITPGIMTGFSLMQILSTPVKAHLGPQAGPSTPGATDSFSARARGCSSSSLWKGRARAAPACSPRSAATARPAMPTTASASTNRAKSRRAR